MTEFIKKMKSWLDMSHFDEAFCRKIDLLERNFAVSNNIFKKYKPIFLHLFKDPLDDPPRPPRSRKQRRPPCNSRELFEFCWTLYILIKGIYQLIFFSKDLFSYFFLSFILNFSFIKFLQSEWFIITKDLLKKSSQNFWISFVIIISELLNEQSFNQRILSYIRSHMDYSNPCSTDHQGNI